MLMERIIYNNIIPFKGFKAITIFPWIFVKAAHKGTFDDKSINHELIHLYQQKEMFVVLFFVWYIVEWFIRLLLYRNKKEAYRNISFEQEAYNNQSNVAYVYCRNSFGWLAYLNKKTYHVE